VGRGANDTFVLNTSGDRIFEVAGGLNSIRTGINKFSLTDTANRGSGVLNVQNLIYTGLGGATLSGNALNGSLIGSTTSANSLVAGTSVSTGQLSAIASKGALTLTLASTDGFSAGRLIAGNGIPAGTTITSVNGRVLTLSKALTSSLPGGSSSPVNAVIATGVETLVGGSNLLGGDTLVGNGRSSLIGAPETMSMSSTTLETKSSSARWRHSPQGSALPNGYTLKSSLTLPSGAATPFQIILGSLNVSATNTTLSANSNWEGM